MIQGRKGRLRERARKWRGLAVIARGYGGERGQGDVRLWDEAALRSILVDDELNEAERAEAIRMHIDAQYEESVEQLEACDTARANEFVVGVQEAVGRE